MSNQDTEFTLTTGKILLIFIGLVVICGAFFGLGYSLGRKSTPLSTNIGSQSQNQAQTSKTGKPEPGVPTTQPTCSGADCGQSATTATPVAAPGQPAASTTPATGSSSNGTEVVAGQQKVYIVQVAAISKQEDADVLVKALQSKSYPVFIANSPADKLLHVQVGPFTDKGEAESMRNRLSADGYNAILK